MILSMRLIQTWSTAFSSATVRLLLVLLTIIKTVFLKE